MGTGFLKALRNGLMPAEHLEERVPQAPHMMLGSGQFTTEELGIPQALPPTAQFSTEVPAGAP